MKKIEDVMKSVKGNAALEEEFKGVKSLGDAVEFFKKQGCETNETELADFYDKITNRELSDAEAAAVAGGKSHDKDEKNWGAEIWNFLMQWWPW